MVKETRYAVAMPRPSLSIRSTPITWKTKRRMQKTPILTTATACSSALTGVGATMAAGSQAWKGMMAPLAKPAR